MRISSLLLALALALAARPAAAKLKIVATVTDLGALAREVTGPEAEITVLARPTQDPHFVDARPNLMLDLNRADAVLLIGSDLEIGWLPVLLKGARNPNVVLGQPGYVDVSQFVQLQDVPAMRVDRSMGDIHPTGNPHITTDPENGIRIARTLAQRFAQLDPGGEKTYAANADAFEKKARAKITAWKAQLAPHAGKPVVTYHRSWIYFTRFAGLTEVGTLEPKPGIPPNAQHVAQLIGVMKQKQVKVLLQESWFPTATSEIVARQTGAALVVVPGFARDGQAYLEHIEDLVKGVADAYAKAAK